MLISYESYPQYYRFYKLHSNNHMTDQLSRFARPYAINMNRLTQSFSHYMIIHKNINSILCYANKHDDIAIIGTSSHELCQIQWTMMQLFLTSEYALLHSYSTLTTMHNFYAYTRHFVIRTFWINMTCQGPLNITYFLTLLVHFRWQH